MSYTVCTNMIMRHANLLFVQLDDWLGEKKLRY